MIPVGYMAKRVSKRPDWFQAANVIDIYSVSGCVSDFADYINYWKHNGYWLFDSPEVIRRLAAEHALGLDGTCLFYYEAHEKEFDGESWHAYEPEPSVPTNVTLPSKKHLEGFDVVTFYAKGHPECSPLSCNSLAERLRTNSHCLFPSFEEAKTNINSGGFTKCEPGPYRIFSVYSVDWPNE
jgi:hypothetical protein